MKTMVRWKSLIPVYCLVLIGLLAVAALGNDVATAVSEDAPITRRNCLVIDAGHGGMDGGAISCTGVKESEINLEIALKLEDLAHLLGIQTMMIRRTDCSVYTGGNTIAAQKVSDLKERVRLINNASNAVVLSIHQNYFTDSKYYGAQVFYAPTQNSKQLAEQLQTAFVNTINPNSRRQIKPANGIYLMQKISTPGILVECGFLSNPAEESLLRSHEYQCKLCAVIISVYSGYLSSESATYNG